MVSSLDHADFAVGEFLYRIILKKGKIDFMKVCPNCQNQVNDDVAFCPICGTQFGNQQNTQNGQAGGNTQNGGNSGYGNPYTAYDPYDHTSEFDPRDISANKVVSMLCYLLSWIGIIIALLAAGNSPYAAFHVRQALKFAVVEILLGIVTLVLCWTVIVPICAVVLYIALLVVKIIAFFQICGGKAKEPYIIRNFGFLR